MAAWEDVNRLALAMPETAATPLHGDRAWRVRDKLIVWERPLRKGDLTALEALKRTPPQGPILGARVEHEVAKLALIESDPDVYFTIPHFDGYPAILVRLERIDLAELEELIVEAWLLRAPKRVVAAYLAERGT